MNKVFVRHTVKDYDQWQKVFTQVKDMRKSAGEKTYEIYNMDDDPNHLIAVFEWDDLNNAKTFFKSGDLKQKMDEAGVSMKPEIYYCQSKESGR